MTYKELYLSILNKYKEYNIYNGDFEAKELICRFAEISKTELILNYNSYCDENIVKKIYCAVDKRVKNYPLQYILGEWTFFRNKFIVGEGVLIPRPETEEIVYRANLFLKNKNNKIIFDLCSGSGCIGISVAKSNPDNFVYLIEKSESAIKYIEKNIELNCVKNVKIIKYDITKGYNSAIFEKPDVILSNPPYIKTSELSSLQAEVCYEPELALDGGEDGLYFYRILIEKWVKYINKDGMFMFEAGEGQSFDIASMLSQKYNVKILNDIYSVSRFTYCEL